MSRRRRPGSPRSRGVVASLASAVLLVPALVGCGSDAVEIEAADLGAEEGEACRALVAALPEEVSGQPRAEVSGDVEYGAAWGDPAIVLTCGVPEPDDFTSTSACVEANGVGWFVPDSVALSGDQTRDVAMTTVGYRPRVRVVVPADYRPSGIQNTMGGLAAAVQAHTELVQECR